MYWICCFKINRQKEYHLGYGYLRGVWGKFHGQGSDGCKFATAAHRHYPPAHTEVAGGTGTADAKKAEVFTPAWLCNRMNNYCDEDWFGRTGVFNTENEDHTWTVTEGKIEFPKRKKWQHYVDSRRLEITCGEAPYLVSRYDVSTGELIVPPKRRIGMLDRKLRIVNENTDTYEEWVKWTIRAFESCYGYEYQGDNVLIARINLLLTFMDYYEERWERQPDDKLLEQIANKIAWNIWQMDGLKDTVPLGKPYEEFRQMTLFDMFGLEEESENEPEAVPCRIFNWRSNSSLKFMDIKEM